MSDYQKMYTAYEPYAIHKTYINEGLMAPGFVGEVLNNCFGQPALENSNRSSKDKAEINDDYIKSYNLFADKKIFTQVTVPYLSALLPIMILPVVTRAHR